MRYHFHIVIGASTIADPEGEELATDEAAMVRAKASVDQILRRPDIYGGKSRWKAANMVVNDSQGLCVGVVPFRP